MKFNSNRKHFTTDLAKKGKNNEFWICKLEKNMKISKPIIYLKTNIYRCIAYPWVDGTLKDFGSPYCVSNHSQSLHTGQPGWFTHPLLCPVTSCELCLVQQFILCLLTLNIKLSTFFLSLYLIFYNIFCCYWIQINLLMD